ncbi:ABC transporter ATP-binding protein [Streptomyces sp. NPDC005438]|uniref:ABC transporter ATP-binding protein n=1 Tax=Streptomyces sp. NPDC005438 TaxID=3156880 RepID=UPI0033A4259A
MTTTTPHDEPPERTDTPAPEPRARTTAEAMRELRAPVRALTRSGLVIAGVGALSQLLPYVAIVELARGLLAPGEPDRARIITVSVVAVVGMALGWTANGLALWLTHVADARVQALIRRRLVTRLGRVPLGWYTDSSSGQVRKAAQDDIDDLHHMIAHHEVDLVEAIVLPLAALSYLVWIDWRLALLALASFPVYAAAYAWMWRGFADKMAQMDAGFGRVSAAIVEFVHGIAVVKSFGRLGRAHEAYRRAVRDFAEQYAGWVRPVIRVEAVTSMVISAPVVALVGAVGGAWYVAHGWVTPLDVLAEILVAMVLPSTIQRLNTGISAQQRARAAAERITTLLDTPPLPVPEQPRTPRGNEVRFRDVHFGYGDKRVVNGVDLHCPAGTVTALVGPSGAGKSTLAHLLLRFHDVDSGSVEVGGVPVSDMRPEDLYRSAGFVLQEVALLHGTVADNLRLGRADATDEELVAAARAAQIHDRVLQLPRGYDSVVGEDVDFSGGEAQRLSVARVLVADTPVLVLDEATASTDAESEARIQRALSAVAADRTVLVIAHRLSTIVGVDQIAVLDEGRVVELGTHERLLALNGRYARMWAAHEAVESA